MILIIVLILLLSLRRERFTFFYYEFITFLLSKNNFYHLTARGFTHYTALSGL